MSDAPAVLVLGGTGEARELAAGLVAERIPVISSLAGRVGEPRLPVGAVRIGGFGGVPGLRTWLHDNAIRVVVDATHPFASGISANAAAAAGDLAVPLVRLCRAPWSPDVGDTWVQVPDIAGAARHLDGRRARVFLTTGRQDVDAFAENSSAWFLIRVVDPPQTAMPRHHTVIRSRGPYHLADEIDLMREHRIDVLVTKNSGGDMTRAKLDAARTLGIEVVMVDRPSEPAMPTVEDAAGAVELVRDLLTGQTLR